MTALLFPAPPVRTVPVKGSAAEYPVHRIFCVGRNYVEHAKEMGAEVDRDAPFYFTKSLMALQASGQTLPYPPGTKNYHYEMELVVAIGKPVFLVGKADARSAIFGYACGLDMTRRDLQSAAKAKQQPWDTGKDVENSAIIAAITPAEAFGPAGQQRMTLTLNGRVKQDAKLTDLVWSLEEIISHLSGLYHLAPGDLIYTGTPAGVGAVVSGDVIEGAIEGLDPVWLSVGPLEAQQPK